MNYRFTSSTRRTNKTKRLALVSTLVAAVALILLSFFSAGLRGAFVVVASPFWKAGNFLSSGTGSIGALITSKEGLYAENQTLKQELLEARSELSDKALVEADDVNLKALLGRTDSDKFLLATVLAKPNLSPYDTLVVDVGSDHEVKTGDKVLVGGNLAIGEVSEVHAHTSEVILYSSNGTKEDVLIGTSGIQAAAEGMGGGTFSAQLPRGVSIAVGDSVTIPSISPKVVGEIEKIDENSNDPFQEIYFSLPVNISELSQVEILHAQQ